MRFQIRHFVMGIPALFLQAGCGVTGSEQAIDRTEIAADSTASEQDGPAPVVIPVQNPLSGASSPSVAGDLALESIDIETLLRLLVDAQLLQMPTGAEVGSPPLSMTYLERLCRELDIPEHRCRQRYGL